MVPRARTGVGASVKVLDEGVTIVLEDGGLETQALFAELDEMAREQFAVEAWTIGMRAIRSAHAQADAARLKDVGHGLLEALDKELARYTADQEKRIEKVLNTYFGPEDGRLEQRMRTFIKDDGDLVRVLREHIGGDNSVLAETLANKIGEDSPILKKLSPTESDGIIQQIQKRLDDALKSHSENVALALDPNTDNSPVKRFLGALQERLQKSQDDQHKQLKDLTAALDATDEDSLLNKLKRDVEKSNRDLLRAINPADPASPLALIKNTLEKLIEKRMEENKQLLEGARERQRRFELEVKQSLARLEKHRKEAERSTHGGFEYEDAVVDFVVNAIGPGPYHVEPTGNAAGAITRSKKGDAVVRFTDEHAFAGCGVVIEAKRAGNYTVASALAELAEARKNRQCDVGVFVMETKRAHSAFPRFARYGEDILVAWDPEDAESHPYLHAAILCAMSLATRNQRPDNEGDITALHKVENDLSNEVERLAKMDGWAETIGKRNDDIREQLRIGRNALQRIIRQANDVLEALNAHTEDARAERQDPISLDEGSLDRARAGFLDANQHEAAPDASLDPAMSASVEPVAGAAFRKRPQEPESGDGDSVPTYREWVAEHESKGLPRPTEKAYREAFERDP